MCSALKFPRSTYYAALNQSLNVDKLKSEYGELTKQKSELTTTYNNCEKEVRELNRKLENLNQYLGRDTASHDEQNKDKSQIL